MYQGNVAQTLISMYTKLKNTKTWDKTIPLKTNHCIKIMIRQAFSIITSN